MQKKLILFLIIIHNFIYSQEMTDLTGDYLGQTPPGNTAELFAPGIISSEDQEHGVPAFSPDGNEVYWISNRPPCPDNENWQSFGKTMKRIGDRWTGPAPSPCGGASCGCGRCPGGRPSL